MTNGTLVAQSRKLTLSGLSDIFDGAFISDKIGFEKPSAEFFDCVRENIGGFEKDSVMIVGDSLTSDMQGGNNAGIICCWYNPNRKTVSTDVKIDYEINDLSEIENII